jgi:putative pyruvate formate lyase activating enzyme
MGRSVSQDELAGIFLALGEMGAENINIVTGSHAVPALGEAIRAARRAGLQIPVLWNSSAYENPDALFLLRDVVDVWLPDLKTLDTDLAARFFRAPDYPEAAEKAILAMMDMQGGREYRGEILQRGVIIRHLVLPGYLESTRKVLRWFADQAQGRALLSVMTQYTPSGGSGPERFVNTREYETVLNWLAEFGIDDGFYQELVQDSAWLPDFNRANPFSSELSVPVWHWRYGFVHDCHKEDAYVPAAL